MFRAEKVPDPSTYGPPVGPVDHKMLARMRDHWEQFPDCNQSAAQHNLSYTVCYYCGRTI